MSKDVRDTGAMGARPSKTAFVGRAAELDDLTARLSALDEWGAATVLVEGEAGIGKSRLVEEFCDRVRSRGALVAVGVCTPAEGGGLPYGPVVGVLRDLAAQLAPHDVAELVEPMQRGFGLNQSSWSDRLDDSTFMLSAAVGLAKTKVFETMLSTVRALAERDPLVLVFEDLHWADSASIELIDFLTRNCGDRRVFLIGTHRSDEFEPGRPRRLVLAELARHPRVSRLEVRGLDRDEIAAMLLNVLGERPDWALIDAVHARSEGNPFFAEELAASRHATTLPAVLSNLIMIRIDDLSVDARHVVAVAAIARAPIHHRLLTDVVELDEAALDLAVVEAVEKNVLVSQSGTNTFQFRHALLREVAYAAIAPGERSRLHRRLAVALTAQRDLRADGPGHAAVELAAHWWEAGAWPETFEASVTAAMMAADLFAMPEAHAHFERALAAHRHAPDGCAYPGIDHSELLLRAADAAYLSGQGPRSVQRAREALELVVADDDPSRTAACYTMLARNAWDSGDVELVFDAFTRAKAALPAGQPSVALAGILAEEARILMLSAHYEAAEAKARDALEVALALGARAQEAHVLSTLGVCVAGKGDVESGLALVREAVDIAEELSLPDQLSRSYANLGHVLLESGYLDEAANLVLDGMAKGGSLLDLRLNSTGQNSSEALIRLGRWDDSEDLLARVTDRGAGSCQYAFYAGRAVTAIRRGRFAEAARVLAIAEEVSVERNAVQERGWIHLLKAELELEQERPRAATEEIDRALSVAAGTDDETLRLEMFALGLRALADDVALARTDRRRVDIDKAMSVARGFVEDAERSARGPVERGWPQSSRAVAFSATCRAEESRLTASDAELWFEPASRWEGVREPYPAAYCRWRAAEAVLATRGERRRAADATQHAWRTCRALKAIPLQTRIERLAERARIVLVDEADVAPTAAQVAADDLGLTPREVEVLTQLARGRTDREIADELFISKKTASVHVSNLLRKLDVANRVEAAEVGQRAGLA